MSAKGSTRVARPAVAVVLILVVAAIAGSAQKPGSPAADAPGAASSTDPRVGLTPGFRDAGTAARHMELVANVPKPPGFYDPKAPFGNPEPPGSSAESDDEQDKPQQKRAGASSGRLDFAMSDLAFRGEHVIAGSFHGFNILNVEDPRRPRIIASIVCPGGQGDVSIHGNLLVMSVEESRGRIDCGVGGVSGRVSAERFRGIRIFDIADLGRPQQVAAVQTCRGSHTHTLVIDQARPESFYVYSSGTGPVRPAEELAACSGKAPAEDPDTALFSIDVIHVPVQAPAEARIVSRPRIFGDAETGAIAALWPGGDHGPGTQKTSVTNQCHDITAFSEIGLAAGACAGNGILLDISDPANPVRLDHVADPNFAYWHSATFNHDGTKVIFTDEWGGGTRPRCRPTDPATWGANAIFDVADRRLRFGSYYKLPAPQAEHENCVAHNGSIVPVPGRDIMVQAWYQGGVSVFDFTDSAAPFEIAFFDRGPIHARDLIVGGHWSAYWYNGHIYASEMARGLDILRLTPSEHLSRYEIAAADLVRAETFNVQQQVRPVWPASPLAARAYLDQLARSRALAPERQQAVSRALARVEKLRTARASDSALGRDLNEVAALLEREAAERAAGADTARLRSLARTMRELAAVK